MIRVKLSWCCYWLGDFAYRFARGWGYVRLMQWAHDLQGSDPRGPWETEAH